MFYIKYRYLLVLALAVYSYFNILFTEGDQLLDNRMLDQVILFFIISGIVLTVWEGNRYIEWRLRNNKVPFRGKANPLIIFFLLSLISVTLITILTLSFFIVLTGEALPSVLTEAKLAFSFAFRINLFLNCIHGIVYYMKQYKISQLQAEQAHKATAEAQFESLRNQINPHFLFNSFNVLSSLVYADPDTAATFLRQLSKVYRYLLYHQEGEKVSLSQELEFIDAYLYLLRIRFGENLRINNEVAGHIAEVYIAPVSLQMLIENAIKHNVVSSKHPMTISIYLEGNDALPAWLVVENTLNLKETPPESTNLGLSNIKQRYKFISQREVSVQSGPDTFKVKLPLISKDQ
ncbi:sensor histidine kinase [Roseivirga sp. BDSF3-8]|uniref:sensor histidine kinase n=1 Tax=Roseivirga sp. BDSF3-8 TaxID=3241598 RepID=UPI003531898C